MKLIAEMASSARCRRPVVKANLPEMNSRLELDELGCSYIVWLGYGHDDQISTKGSGIDA